MILYFILYSNHNIRCAYDRILIPCIKLIKNRYASLPKINLYKRKRLPQRKVEESDDIFYYTPAAYENSTGPVFLNHPSKYNTKRLKTPRGKKRNTKKRKMT